MLLTKTFLTKSFTFIQFDSLQESTCLIVAEKTRLVHFVWIIRFQLLSSVRTRQMSIFSVVFVGKCLHVDLVIDK